MVTRDANPTQPPSACTQRPSFQTTSLISDGKDKTKEIVDKAKLKVHWWENNFQKWMVKQVSNKKETIIMKL